MIREIGKMIQKIESEERTMNKTTQCAKIVKYMEINGSITQREAIMLGIYRLASRIHDLKENGIGIKTEMIEVKNADGTKSHVAKYTFVEDEADLEWEELFGGENK